MQGLKKENDKEKVYEVAALVGTVLVLTQCLPLSVTRAVLHYEFRKFNFSDILMCTTFRR